MVFNCYLKFNWKWFSWFFSWTELNWTWTNGLVLSVLSSCISSEPNFGITTSNEKRWKWNQSLHQRSPLLSRKCLENLCSWHTLTTSKRYVITHSLSWPRIHHFSSRRDSRWCMLRLRPIQSLQTWSVTVVGLVFKFVRLSDYKNALV